MTVTMDLGDGRELEAVRDRAIAAGAVRAHVLDLRDDFARDFVLPAFKAEAIRGAGHPLATELGRALIAQKLVEIAAIEQASAVAHGCVGSDQAALERSIRALNPRLRVLAPASESGMTSSQAEKYARERGLPLPTSSDAPFVTDANLWGRSIEGGLLDDPGCEPPESVYATTRSALECPEEPAYVEIGFEQGVPTGINGVSMPFGELIASLGIIAGAHGLGRIDVVENRSDGKSRRICEAPAAVVLHAAHQDVQKLVTTRELDRFARSVSLQYAELVYNGSWFEPLRPALDAFVENVQQRVTGIVRLKLFKGKCQVVGRQSPFALAHKGGAAEPAGARNRPA
jgi:argininosuccinate synthase